MKNVQLFEIETVEQARNLPSETTVRLGTVSPGSWMTVNPRYQGINAELLKRAPFGWESWQSDGIGLTWTLLISDRPVAEILDGIARRAGYRDAAEMDAEILGSDSEVK